MPYSVLYYPNFEPNQKWLRSVLLFFDGIHRIIPPEAQHTDSRQTQELVHWMPDAFQTISPTDEDKYFDDLNFDRLRKAFARIRDESGGRPDKHFRFSITKEGCIAMKGDVWLSNAKLQERVRDLLFDYNLANDVRNPITGRGPFGDTFPANKEASNLIVSYVADRIAKRTGFDTITDSTIPHAVQALDAINVSPETLSRESDGLLASAVALSAIPARIEQMSVPEFQELREAFVDIRPAFHELIKSLASRAKLERQQSAGGAEARIQQAVEDYKRQYESFRKTAPAQKIDAWVPIAFQGILGIVGVFGPEALQALMATGIVGIEIMKQGVAARTKPIEHEDTYRMLCKLQRRIDNKKAVLELL